MKCNDNINPTHHFWGNLHHCRSNRLSRSPIVSHFKFYGVSNLEMFDVATELGEVKEQSRLSFAALNESVRVLGKKRRQ